MVRRRHFRPIDGQAPKIYPVTATTWSEGISLTGLEIPAGQTANVTLVGTKISGTSDQRLTATLDVTGNFATVSAADAVRLTDTTQGTITPTEGFISVPTFDFGKMNIASKTQQSGLKKRPITTKMVHAILTCELRKINRIGR